MGWISIKVIVDEAHQGQTEAVCAALRSLGMRVETAMPEIGVIFGAAEESLLPRVAMAEGVLSAAPEGRFHVPPDRKAPQ